MDVDLPWEEDPLRDFPNQREHFMQVWHKELKAINANYHVISGQGDVRFQRAVQAINGFLEVHF